MNESHKRKNFVISNFLSKVHEYNNALFYPDGVLFIGTNFIIIFSSFELNSNCETSIWSSLILFGSTFTGGSVYDFWNCAATINVPWSRPSTTIFVPYISTPRREQVNSQSRVHNVKLISCAWLAVLYCWEISLTAWLHLAIRKYTLVELCHQSHLFRSFWWNSIDNVWSFDLVAMVPSSNGMSYR